nr:post-GPI attachment to proteins factor 6 [Chrysemys picta bellii]
MPGDQARWARGLSRLEIPTSQPTLAHGPSSLPSPPPCPLADGLFVTDYFTRTPRKLSPFRSFASIELFHFRIPEDTLVAVWNLITFKEQGGTFGDRCPDRSVTVYFRSGAPPVIAPLHTHFPRDTAIPSSFTLTLTWSLPNRTTGVFNITSPLPGDWFLAAHLPKDEGKISVKVRGQQGKVNGHAPDTRGKNEPMPCRVLELPQAGAGQGPCCSDWERGRGFPIALSGGV